jgi:hypothetical protein
MKLTLFLILICSSLNLFGQKLTDEVGDIEVQLVGHNYKRNSDYELTKRKTNKRNHPYLIMYFDSTGTLLKSVSFGKQHNTDLNLTNKINLYNYENGKLANSIEYESDYQKNVYPYWQSKYNYNSNGQLIDESTYYFKTDSLFHKTTYEYDKNSNQIRSILNPTYYYEREFDSLNRISVLKQIHVNKLRWDWNYTYSDNKRIGIFQTYYNDGKDYSKKEVQTYNSQGLLIETEKVKTSKSGIDEKTKIYYFDNGLIKRVEYFESYNNQKGYEMVSYFDIKVKRKTEIDSRIAEIINEKINIE